MIPLLMKSIFSFKSLTLSSGLDDFSCMAIYIIIVYVTVAVISTLNTTIKCAFW